MERKNKINKFISVSLVSLLFTSLTACGGGMGRLPNSVSPTIPDTTAPTTPVTDPGSAYPSQPVYDTPVVSPTIPDQMPNQAPNTLAATFEVDKDSLRTWQARGIAVSGGSIYVAAVHNGLIFKKGTVLQMSASNGEKWKDLGSSWLGMSHKMDETLMGVAVAGGNIYAIDSSQGLYSIQTSGREVKALQGSGGADVAGTTMGVFVSANGMLERGDMTGTSRIPMGIMTSSGIGADSRGSVYFITGARVGMIDPTGRPRDVVMQGLTSPVDVAGDGRTGDIYVLEQGGVKRFGQNGQMLASFSHGATQPSSIAVDESGFVYISDFGADGDSKILKFNPPGIGALPNTGANPAGNYGTDPYSTGAQYGTGTQYGAGTQYGTGTQYGAGTQYGTGAQYGAGTQYGTGTGQYNSYAVPQQQQRRVY